MIYRRLQARREYANGGSSYTSKTLHTISYPSGQTSDMVPVLDPNGNVLSQTVHVMQGSPLDSLSVTGTGCNAWNEGLEVQTQYGSPELMSVTNTYTNAAQSTCMSNPQLTTRLTTLTDTNQQSQSLYQYDQCGNIWDEKDSDWDANAPGAVLREIKPVYWYQHESAYAPPSANLIRLPWYQDTLDGNGNKVAHSEWYYDQTAPADLTTLTGHNSTRGAGFTAPRGNVTYRGQWLNTSNSEMATSYAYDIAGNVLSVTDPNNHSASISYGDNYSDGQNRNTFAFPTAVTNALGQSAYI
jgi:YD repeat-containing protein